MTGSSGFQKNLQRLDRPTLVMSKKLQVLADPCNCFDIFEKKYNDWIKCISKKTGSANTCNFFDIFEKIYNDWIKAFSKSRWTGLMFLETEHIKYLQVNQTLVLIFLCQP